MGPLLKATAKGHISKVSLTRLVVGGDRVRHPNPLGQSSTGFKPARAGVISAVPPLRRGLTVYTREAARCITSLPRPFTSHGRR